MITNNKSGVGGGDVFSAVIIAFTMFAQISHGLIEMQSDKEKHGMYTHTHPCTHTDVVPFFVVCVVFDRLICSKRVCVCLCCADTVVETCFVSRSRVNVCVCVQNE